MSGRVTPGPLVSAACMLGIGLGGFVDGILFHQILQLHGMLSELHARPIAGDVYTQATNVEDERNGLVDADGTVLVPPGLLGPAPRRE